MESKSTEASIQAHNKRNSGRQALRLKKELSSTLSAREEHPRKALSPMLVRDAGSSLSAREEHPAKAQSPMLVRDAGSSLSAREEHP